MYPMMLPDWEYKYRVAIPLHDTGFCLVDVVGSETPLSRGRILLGCNWACRVAHLPLGRLTPIPPSGRLGRRWPGTGVGRRLYVQVAHAILIFKLPGLRVCVLGVQGLHDPLDVLFLDGEVYPHRSS